MAEKKDLRYGEPTTERRKITKEEFLRAILGDIDPEKFAGEGWFSTDEYQPGDVADPFVRQEIGREGDYYPAQVSGDERKLLRMLLARTG